MTFRKQILISAFTMSSRPDYKISCTVKKRYLRTDGETEAEIAKRLKVNVRLVYTNTGTREVSFISHRSIKPRLTMIREVEKIS